MNKYAQIIKAQFEKSPIETVAVGALALTAFAKVIDAWSSSKSRRAYARAPYTYGPPRR